ncbi:MAG: hypothetical protein ABSB74_12955 [Tepidisphaeraceae bacterium]
MDPVKAEFEFCAFRWRAVKEAGKPFQGHRNGSPIRQINAESAVLDARVNGFRYLICLGESAHATLSIIVRD